MMNSDRRHFLKTEQFCGLEASVPSDNDVICVDDDGVDKPELADTVCNLLHLLFRVQLGIAFVCDECGGGNQADFRLVC